MTRGLRNNNPLNMRHDRDTWKGEVKPGQDAAFKQFRTMAWGYRAAFKLLHNYQRLHGCRTLADFIRRWAPPSENNTDAYIRIVAQPSIRSMGRSCSGSWRPCRRSRTAPRPMPPK